MSEAEEIHASAMGLLEGRQVVEAHHALDEAEQAGYNANICRAGRWTCSMLLGDFASAWRESCEITSSGETDPHCLWDGSPFAGKRVMLRCLHGLGDTLQFIRYASFVRVAAREVIVEAHPELLRILRCVPGVDRAITWGDAAPHPAPVWDWQAEVTELPRIFNTTLSTVPSSVPYIHLPRSLRTRAAVPRAGVVWASSGWNPARCVPLEDFAGALDSLQWDLVTLQHGPERERFGKTQRSAGDVLDTANEMLELDLVISVDTMTAHLAGALGLPVWVLLPFEADWRWMLDRSDSPWYPTMRLFRQQRPGDWSHPLNELRCAACAF